MIIGTGTDLCQIARIAGTLDRFADRFTHRCFTAQERARADRRPEKRAARYAQHFAAKEACSKALGTGLRKGVFWRDMEVVSLPSGKPTLVVTNGAFERATRLMPPGYVPLFDLSLTDDAGMAHAMVILSAVTQEAFAVINPLRHA